MGALASSDEAVFVGVGGGGGPRWQAELGEDVLEVACDGVLADEQLGADFAVGLALGDRPQHLTFACGHGAGRRPVGGSHELRHPSQVGLGAKLVERRASGVEFPLGAVLVPECAQ